MSDNQPEPELDVRGLLCPLPVLRARKKLLTMERGQVLTVRASDPMSAIDMPHFCSQQGYELLATDREGDIFCFRIRRT